MLCPKCSKRLPFFANYRIQCAHCHTPQSARPLAYFLYLLDYAVAWALIFEWLHGVSHSLNRLGWGERWCFSSALVRRSSVRSTSFPGLPSSICIEQSDPAPRSAPHTARVRVPVLY